MGLTREEALRHIEINLITLYDIDENVIECNDANKIIDQIFNDHEAQLKAKDEEIERLEAESKQSYIEGSKSCDDFIQHLHKQIEELSK